MTYEEKSNLDLESHLEETILDDSKANNWILLKYVLVKIVIPAILVFIVVNIIFKDNVGNTLSEIIEKANASGNYKVAYNQYGKLVRKDFFNLDYHRGYLRSYFKLTSSGNQNPIVCDSGIKIKYAGYTNDKDSKVADVGYYGLGYYAVCRNQYCDALKYYKKIESKQQKYINNSIGFTYLQLGDYEKAKDYLYKEIQLGGNIEGAYSNLGKVLFKQRDLEALRQLVCDESVRDYLPWPIVRYIHLKQFNLLKYISSSIRFDFVTTAGFFAAVLVLIAWFQYLRKIDIFEPEKLFYLLVTLLLGMLFSELCIFLYDFWYFALDIKLKNSAVGDLVYCIFGIGFIEETVKIIPFLIMLKFSRQVNESVDYVIYASVSALGFAFMENLIYFQDVSLQCILSRAVTAVLLHMSLSSFAMYGLYYSKYENNNKYRVLCFSVSFFVAILIHGLYDFFLISETTLPVYKMLSFAILILSVNRFSLIIKNALNISEFNVEKKVRVEYLSRYLVYAMSAIILFQYVFMAYRFGSSNANHSMGPIAIIFYIMMFVIIKNLGTIVIARTV